IKIPNKRIRFAPICVIFLPAYNLPTNAPIIKTLATKPPILVVVPYVSIAYPAIVTSSKYIDNINTKLTIDVAVKAFVHNFSFSKILRPLFSENKTKISKQNHYSILQQKALKIKQ